MVPTKNKKRPTWRSTWPPDSGIPSGKVGGIRPPVIGIAQTSKSNLIELVVGSLKRMSGILGLLEVTAKRTVFSGKLASAQMAAHVCIVTMLASHLEQYIATKVQGARADLVT